MAKPARGAAPLLPYAVPVTPAEISRTVACAVRRAVDEGVLCVAVPERVRVERPRPGGCGDYATNAALRLAGPAGLPPRAVAEALRQRISGTQGIERVEITGPGFLNFTLVPDGAGAVVRTVLEQGLRYGHGGGVPYLSGRATARPDAAQASRLGADAARWDALLGGGELLLVRREGNPLFTVQYAYARSRALLHNAADLGFWAGYAGEADDGDYADAVDVDDVAAPALLTALVDYPAFVEAAEAEAAEAEAAEAEMAEAEATGAAAGTGKTAAQAGTGAAQRLARHLVLLADAFLVFHVTVLPAGDEKPSAAHGSRLALAEAAGTVLAGGLSLFGISAPENI